MTVEAETIHEVHSPLVERSGAVKRSVPTLDMEQVPGSDWDSVAATFDGIAQEQLFSFAKGRWPHVACEPIIFRRDGEIIGGTLIMIQPLPLGVADIAVAKWAPVLKDNTGPDVAENYDRIIETLIGEYADRRGMMLSILPKAEPNPENIVFEHLKTRGFSTGPALLFPNRYIVNLRLSDDDMRKSFGQKWRYHLKKSLKQELSFEHADQSRLPEFDALYQTMAERKKFADHSAYETISTLFETSNPLLKPELFYVRQEGEVIAGAIIFKAGDTAVYLYGATNHKALPSRAGYFLHWEIMRWLRENTSARWYDLGGTDGFQGLHQFKKGMVGSEGHIEPVPPVMNYASHTKARLLGDFAYWARETMHQVRRKIEAWRADMATPDQGR